MKRFSKMVPMTRSIIRPRTYSCPMIEGPYAMYGRWRAARKGDFVVDSTGTGEPSAAKSGTQEGRLGMRDRTFSRRRTKMERLRVWVMIWVVVSM